jgi:hypothetical protein
MDGVEKKIAETSLAQSRTMLALALKLTKVPTSPCLNRIGRSFAIRFGIYTQVHLRDTQEIFGQIFQSRKSPYFLKL